MLISARHAILVFHDAHFWQMSDLEVDFYSLLFVCINYPMKYTQYNKYWKILNNPHLQILNCDNS